ncbi:TPA: hypothetical protein I8035_003397 [Legionella pneumophila]|nr:DUF1780 domain-containing protein [Legionella pneumophila]HAT2114456.1 hypothetical protein [Legionella pneumophila]HAT2116211.1 hypothetical protein [Legionella pneumophila]
MHLEFKNEDEILNNIKSMLGNTNLLYSRKGTKIREGISLDVFLTLLRLPFKPGDMFEFPLENCPSRADIKFRTGNFQIKNIPDDNCRITQESKEIYERNKNITQVKDLNLLSPLKDCNSPKTVLGVIEEEINRLENKGKKPKYTLCEKKELDLLIYITRKLTARMQSNIIPVYYRDFFKKAGYRSISFVLGDIQAMVLYAQNNAPDFIFQKKLHLFTEE